MSIGNATLKEDGAYIAPTDGTAVSFNRVTGGDTSIVTRIDNDTGLINLREVVWSVTGPVARTNAPAGWTQARERFFFKIPKTLANGNRTVNTASFQMSTDLETTDAEKLQILRYCCQFIGDSDFNDFYLLHDLS